MQIGPIEASAYAGATGFDASLYVRRSPHPEWGFKRQRCIVALWYCRGCDMGVCIWDRRIVWRIIGPNTEPPHDD